MCLTWIPTWKAGPILGIEDGWSNDKEVFSGRADP